MKQAYITIVNKILMGIKLSRDIRFPEYDALIERLLVINKMVMLANDGRENHNLRSTQSIAKIMFDYLNEIGITIEIE